MLKPDLYERTVFVNIVITLPNLILPSY